MNLISSHMKNMLDSGPLRHILPTQEWPDRWVQILAS